MSTSTATIIGAALIAAAILIQGYLPARPGTFQINDSGGPFWRLDTRTGVYQFCGEGGASRDKLGVGGCSKPYSGREPTLMGRYGRSE